MSERRCSFIFLRLDPRKGKLLALLRLDLYWHGDGTEPNCRGKERSVGYWYFVEAFFLFFFWHSSKVECCLLRV